MQKSFSKRGYKVFLREGKVSITKNYTTISFSFSSKADLKEQMKFFSVYSVKVAILELI